jgi:hypothetical protein
VYCTPTVDSCSPCLVQGTQNMRCIGKLQSATKYCKVLQSSCKVLQVLQSTQNTRCDQILRTHRTVLSLSLLQGTQNTCCIGKLQSTTKCYKVLQSTTKYYKVLQVLQSNQNTRCDQILRTHRTVLSLSLLQGTQDSRCIEKLQSTAKWVCLCFTAHKTRAALRKHHQQSCSRVTKLVQQGTSQVLRLSTGSPCKLLSLSTKPSVRCCALKVVASRRKLT